MSPQCCLLFLVEKWRKALDNGNKCGVLLTDLSKAFDCLIHDLLIAKLHAYGFDLLSLKLIHSYLTNRFQRVKVNASTSTWNEIKTGVPQGSILGPMLYNLNSNDLFLFMCLDIANFADDNSPFTTAKTSTEVLSKIENESSNLLDWIGFNGLKANPDKFHLLLSDPNKDLSIIVDGFEIENSNSQKLLGITIDNKLSFDEHVSSICTKASQKIHALSRVSKFMSFRQRKTIFHTFILSHFGYCPLVWMLHSRKLNHRINKLHERALRIVYNDYKSSFQRLLEISNSFTIHERNIQSLAIEIYKVVNNLAPKIMNIVFQKNLNTSYPRQSYFKTFNVKSTSWGIKSLAYLGPKIWNLVPKEFKTLSLSPFLNEEFETGNPHVLAVFVHFMNLM